MNPTELSEFCQSLMERAPGPMAALEGAGHIVRFVNPAFCRLVGKDRATLIGKVFADIVRHEDRRLSVLDRVYRTGEWESHTESDHPESHPPYWSYSVWPILDADQQPAGVMMHVTEATQSHQQTGAMNQALLISSVRQHELTEVAEKLNAQLRAEMLERESVQEALREKEAWQRLLMEHVKDFAIFSLETDGRVKDWNTGAEEAFGFTREEILGRSGAIVFTPEDRSAGIPEKEMITAARDGCALDERWHLRKNGERFFASGTMRPLRDIAGQLLGFVKVARDISERKRAEEERLKSSKLESIGVLAGGIAHDFNNLLTAIVGNLYLSKASLDPGHPLYARLAEAEKACFRAQSLTQQLLTFARGGLPVTKTVVLGKLLEEWVLFALHGSNVEADFDVQPDLWPVEADEGQLNQVINNLVINAMQAMAGGGATTITADNIVLGANSGLPLAAGRYVRISVTDQGAGIPKEYLSRIFDPFFTTKSKGSGLGLTTSYAIVQKHRGHLAVESEPGKGTTCLVYLPASIGTVATSDPGTSVFQGEGRILVMDDEEAVRGVIGDLLRAAGYQVECVGDGTEAVDRYRKALERGEPFDMVILDLTVPGGMGGKDAVEHLLRLDPDVNAIVTSGYSDDPVMAQFRQHGFRARLTKPYEIEALHETLRRLKEGYPTNPDA